MKQFLALAFLLASSLHVLAESERTFIVETKLTSKTKAGDTKVLACPKMAVRAGYDASIQIDGMKPNIEIKVHTPKGDNDNHDVRLRLAVVNAEGNPTVIAMPRISMRTGTTATASLDSDDINYHVEVKIRETVDR